MAERYINAAKDGNVDILREATRKDLNSQDEDGMTATMWAAQNGNLEALRLIVGREGEVNKCDYLGLTALHHASMRGHIDVVSYLVHWGCNVYSLDNDMHSAQDLASIHDYHEIIRFLDKVLDQKRYKNPKSVARQKEEAIRSSENNQKKYEKLKEVAAKRAEKEQRKMEKEINNNNNINNTSKPRKNIFQSITIRMKGNSTHSKASTGAQSNFSDMAGMTYSRNAKGVSKKLQARKNNVEYNSDTMRSEFKTSVMDNDGNRTLKSIGNGQGLYGTVSEVMYVNSTAQSTRRSFDDDIGVSRRPRATDVFPTRQSHGNIYRAKSESDLLDSGVDSYYGEEEDDEELSPSLFNRTEFGKISFLPKSPMLSTLQSFDDGGSKSRFDQDSDMNGHAHQRDDDDLTSPYTGSEDLSASTKLPWDLDDVDGLDENDESAAARTTASALEMFLASNGLTNYLHVFSQEEVDLQLLLRMNEAELKDLGLPLGPRKKLGEAVQRRRTVLENPRPMVDSYL